MLGCAWAAERAAVGETEEELGRGRGEATERGGWAGVERGMGKSWAYAPTPAHAGERKRACGREGEEWAMGEKQAG